MIRCVHDDGPVETKASQPCSIDMQIITTWEFYKVFGPNQCIDINYFIHTDLNSFMQLHNYRGQHCRLLNSILEFTRIVWTSNPNVWQYTKNMIAFEPYKYCNHNTSGFFEWFFKGRWYFFLTRPVYDFLFYFVY